MASKDLRIHLSKNHNLIKICLGVSALLIIILVIVLLIFTIFKPRNPTVSVHPLHLEHFQLLSPNSSIAPLGLVITIENPNYASFKHGNCSGYVKYRGIVIAEAPFGARSYPARSTTNVTTTADIETAKLINDPNFWSDIAGGVFNLTSEAKISGKVSMIKIIRLKAKIYLSCGISLNITAVNATSSCMSKLKL
ncbi:unnamed protein product [Sphenostylis stenocarpa]|uniref:Late embryogenesis abundant protein LEA-2 subgroup domain-containing protein n=1 Tax=Sphenostylis stenocarpa TaxID=92480 RepID=A0AA86W6N3_9FABA|nr:unnamed protein product [Sphenostylis stenocarpa]